MNTALALRPDQSSALLPANLPASLPVAVRRAAELLAPDSPDRACQLTTDALSDALLPLISGVAFLLGHSKQLLSGADLLEMANAAAEMVQRLFPGLTPAEIGRAWRCGAAGDYPEPNTLDLVALPTLRRWLERYVAGERRQALLAVAREPQPLALPPAPRNYAAELLALVAQAKAGQLPAAPELDFANVLYHWLKSLGALQAGYWPAGPPNHEAIRAEEAEAMMKGPAPLDKSARRQRTTFIDILADGGAWPAGHPLAKTVANACKKRVLREWLQQCADKETDVPALLAMLAAESDYPHS